MPGIIEGIAFMPPNRDSYRDSARERMGVRRINRSRNPDEVSVGCFGSSSSAAAASSSSANNNGGNGGASTPTTTSTPRLPIEQGLDLGRPYISYMVAVPDQNYISASTTSVEGPRELLTSWTGTIILFAHGNAEDLTNAAYYWRLAQLLNVCVVAYDYLGYGWSSGSKSDCTEANAFKAVKRMFSFIVDDCRKDRSKVVVMGRSLGSGSATHLAYEECKRHAAVLKQQQKNASSTVSGTTASVSTTAVPTTSTPPLAALILYSPLYSAVAATGKLWASGIFGDIMCNYAKVGDIIKHCPILIIHGTMDEVIPFRCAQELYVKCGGKIVVDEKNGKRGDEDAETAAPTTATGNRKAYFRPMPNCGHNDIEHILPRPFVQCVTEFMRLECGGGGRRLGGGGGASAGAPNNNNGGGGVQAKQFGEASKPVVADDDPVWGRK